MDHTALFEAVKAVAPDMEICIGVEVWGTSNGLHSETTWQIYLSEPGTFFRGATAEAAFDAFKAVYAPAPSAEKLEHIIDLAVSTLTSGRAIDAKEAMEIGAQLARETKLDPQVCEHLIFWHSRGDAERPTYMVWLAGAASGKSVAEIMTELAPPEVPEVVKEVAPVQEKALESAPAEA